MHLNLAAFFSSSLSSCSCIDMESEQEMGASFFLYLSRIFPSVGTSSGESARIICRRVARCGPLSRPCGLCHQEGLWLSGLVYKLEVQGKHQDLAQRLKTRLSPILRRHFRTPTTTSSSSFPSIGIFSVLLFLFAARLEVFCLASSLSL